MLHPRLARPLALVAIALLAGLSGALANNDATATTCRNEGTAFWFWSFLAGSDRTDEVTARNTAVSRIVTLTRDGQRLQGLKLASAHVPAAGAILVIQGNAMLASGLIERMEPLRQAGADVYMYDFRGYGKSTGDRRIAAMSADYREILEKLLKSNPRVGVYALSFGGVLLLNSGFDFGRLHAVLLDAVPSTVDPFKCTRDYAPTSHLPSDCRGFVAHASVNDPVLPPPRSRALLEAVEKCGGRAVWTKSPFHPFEDEPIGEQIERLTSMAHELGVVEEVRHEQ